MVKDAPDPARTRRPGQTVGECLGIGNFRRAADHRRLARGQRWQVDVVIVQAGDEGTAPRIERGFVGVRGKLADLGDGGA